MSMYFFVTFSLALLSWSRMVPNNYVRRHWDNANGDRSSQTLF